MSKKHIRLKDIAEKLNISIASVSRALSDKPDISQATKEKVLALVQEMNYERNEFAIHFKNQQTFTLGLIIPQVVHHFFSNVINGILEQAEQRGYNVIIFQSNEMLENEIKGIEALKKSMIDGFIISLSDTTKHFDHIIQLQKQAYPVVLIDKVSDKIACNKVICDDYKGAFDATQHLINLGKTRIAHITGITQPTTTVLRFSGYEDALKAQKLPLDMELIKKCNLISQEEGRSATIELLNLSPKIDAIFCATDPVAIGALEAIKSKGLSIPEDIAIIGFSDWKMSSVVNPPLSSVCQSDHKMGTTAANLLIDEIQNEKEDIATVYKTVIVDTYLKPRASTIGKVPT